MESEKRRLQLEAAAYRAATCNHLFLSIEFETLQDYLVKLETCARLLGELNERLCVYLAAAVSDFYIPDDKVSIADIIHIPQPAT